MKALRLLLLFILPTIVFAQNMEKVNERIIVAKADKASFQMIADSLLGILPEKSIYLIGETHGNKANDFIFLPLLKKLNAQNEVNYILMEMNHSLFFGYNLFLKYRDIQILADFWNLKDKDAGSLANRFKNEIALYDYNSSLPELKKIQYIGADFDLSNTAGARLLTQYQYITAIKYFKKYSIQKLPHEIDKIFDEIIHADVDNVRFLIERDNELKKIAAIHKEELKSCFGEFYKDFYIIINSYKTYPMGRRDPGMANNLENAYQAIKEMNPHSEPKFFGSFGAVHVIPGNNGSFGSKMNRSSIIEGGVAFIGTSYFNSTTNYAKNIKIIDKSSLGGLSKTEKIQADSFLRSISEQQKNPITLLGRFNNFPKGKLDFLKGFDAIFVFTGF